MILSFWNSIFPIMLHRNDAKLALFILYFQCLTHHSYGVTGSPKDTPEDELPTTDPVITSRVLDFHQYRDAGAPLPSCLSSTRGQWCSWEAWGTCREGCVRYRRRLCACPTPSDLESESLLCVSKKVQRDMVQNKDGKLLVSLRK